MGWQREEFFPDIADTVTWGTWACGGVLHLLICIVLKPGVNKFIGRY